MSAWNDQQRDTNRLRQRADEADRSRAREQSADVVIEHPRRLFMRSPNGTYWQLDVTDAGALTITNAGSNPL